MEEGMVRRGITSGIVQEGLEIMKLFHLVLIMPSQVFRRITTSDLVTVNIKV